MAWGKPVEQRETVTCSLTKPPDVYLEPTARQKISYLMAEYPNQEWLAYLVGKKSEHGNIFVEDISVPPHVAANGASAEAEPLHVPKNCVGVIHSHHHMGAFHSGTDQAYVDRNFPVSITVAKGREGNLAYDAVSLQKTPCGKSITLKCSVKYVQPKPLFDKEQFLKEAKENIDKGKKVYVHQGDLFPGQSGHYYLPMRYRNIPGLFEITVDKSGGVLSKAEVEDIKARGGMEDGE